MSFIIPVRFECQQTGQCCISHDTHGYVFLTKQDRERLADHLSMTLEAFTKEHCALGVTKISGDKEFYHLSESKIACKFLKDKRCTVHIARPTQCRTWPFWSENMNAKAWSETMAFCPGIGKGPELLPKEIKALVDEQKLADKGEV